MRSQKAPIGSNQAEPQSPETGTEDVATEVEHQRHVGDVGRGFQFGEFYSRSEIHDRVGGGVQDYLPHTQGLVVCGCFSTVLNPDAPSIVLPGRGSGIEKWAGVFGQQRWFVPCFMKRGTGQWEHVGNYRVASQSHRPNEIAEHAASTLRDDITSVLHLERER